ncbi:hypothetical protein OROHE_007201 [Orobanche hederae]
MAAKYDAHVVGINLSVNMVSFAMEHAIGLNCSVEFEVADYTKKTYADVTFDVIYSRDTILHIQDKPPIFKSFYKWLKSGGRVLISDYCEMLGLLPKSLLCISSREGMIYMMLKHMARCLKMLVLMRSLLRTELIRAIEDYNDIVGGWNSKLVRSSSGEQRWGLFIAKKK